MPIMLMLLLVGFSQATAPTLPSGIINYTQLGLSASWSSVKSAYVQQMVNITESSFSYIAYNSNFANFEFFYSNGTVIPGWIESNSSGKIITWVKIKNTTTSFYVGFASKTTNLLSSSCTSGIGEAPQLSSTYAEYDTGPCVFPYYQRWGGLSALPSNWNKVSSTVVTFASTYTEVAPPSSTGGWYGIYFNPIPSSLSSTQAIWEFYGNMYDSVNVGSYAGTSNGTTGNWAGYSFSEGNSNLIYLGNDNNQWFASTGHGDTNVNKVYSMQMNSATSLSMLINYTSIYSTTSATSETLAYFDFAVSNYFGDIPSNPQYIYWLRTRTLPPNGVMPTVSIVGPPTLTITPNPSTYGQSVTITATCTLVTDSCALDYPNLTTTLATGTGTATYTYSAYALAAGNYAKYYANDITLGLNSTPQTLTINKNSTYTLTLSNCTTGALPYACATTGTIATHSNQLLASLYLNNNLVGSTNTIITSTIANQIGVFAYTFNTTGNANYTAKSANVLFYKSVPITFYNVTAAGALGTHSIIAPKYATTLSTYYPYLLSVPAFNSITYTLTQKYNSGTPATLFSAVNNIRYTPPANQLTGNYLYSLAEMQGSTSLLFNLSLIPANMLSISSFSTNPSTCIQYLPCLATATFTAKPTSWKIVAPNEPLTNQHVNTSADEQFDSPNLTISNFANSITLTYGQFSPSISFQLNATNNPAVASLTQTPFKVITSNTIPAAPYTRKIDNITGYSESSKSKIAVNFTISSSYFINNYTFSNSSVLAGNNIGVYIPSSTYQNPAVTQEDLSIVGSDTGTGSVFYDAINSYCPSIVTTTPTNYNIYTVNANGSLYTFTIYRGYSQTLTGTYMKVLGGTSQNNSVAMQTFKINSNPYSVPLVNGQPYAFAFFNCTQAIYQT
ncbi:MAG: hypothetical protein QW582_03350, partial [Candidatus Micrarchaeaceae archaeon]